MKERFLDLDDTIVGDTIVGLEKAVVLAFGKERSWDKVGVPCGGKCKLDVGRTLLVGP